MAYWILRFIKKYSFHLRFPCLQYYIRLPFSPLVIDIVLQSSFISPIAFKRLYKFTEHSLHQICNCYEYLIHGVLCVCAPCCCPFSWTKSYSEVTLTGCYVTSNDMHCLFNSFLQQWRNSYPVVIDVHCPIHHIQDLASSWFKGVPLVFYTSTSRIQCNFLIDVFSCFCHLSFFP